MDRSQNISLHFICITLHLHLKIVPRQHEMHDTSRFKCHALHTNDNHASTQTTVTTQHKKDRKTMMKRQRHNNNTDQKTTTNHNETTIQQPQCTHNEITIYNNHNETTHLGCQHSKCQM